MYYVALVPLSITLLQENVGFRADRDLVSTECLPPSVGSPSATPDIGNPRKLLMRLMVVLQFG
jgi:hypothetical protein